MAYIVEYRLPVAGFAYGFQHSVDVGFYFFLCAGMARFVIYFKSYNRRIVLVSQSGVGIGVSHQTIEISFLCGNSFRFGVHAAFVVLIRKAACRLVPFGISVPEVCLCGNHDMDIPFFQLGNQVVHQVQMIVF